MPLRILTPVDLSKTLASESPDHFDFSRSECGLVAGSTPAGFVLDLGDPKIVLELERVDELGAHYREVDGNVTATLHDD